MPKLKAFPFDAENPLGGDHEFYAPDDAVDYVEGDTFEVLVDRVDHIRFDDINRMLAFGEINQEQYDREKADSTPIVGFWVVTERDLNLAKSVWPAYGTAGSDSATYRYNSASKRVIKEAAIGVVNGSGFCASPTPVQDID